MKLDDKYIFIFHDVIRDILSKLDLETSIHFINGYYEEMSKLKQTNLKK